MLMLADVAKLFAFTDLEVSLKNNGANLGWCTPTARSQRCWEINVRFFFFSNAQ